jgi:hypothetical protein
MVLKKLYRRIDKLFTVPRKFLALLENVFSMPDWPTKARVSYTSLA